MNIVKARKLGEYVDTLGHLDAQIARLQAKRATYAKMLKAEGPLFIGDDSLYVDGNDYAVSVSITGRDTVAWKKVATQAGASRQLITGNTKTTPVVTLKVTARNIDRKAA